MTPIVTYFYTVLLSSLPLAPTTVFLITRQFSDDISGMTVVLPTIVLTILCIPGQRLLIPQNTTILSFLFLTFSLPLIILAFTLKTSVSFLDDDFATLKRLPPVGAMFIGIEKLFICFVAALDPQYSHQDYGYLTFLDNKITEYGNWLGRIRLSLSPAAEASLPLYTPLPTDDFPLVFSKLK